MKIKHVFITLGIAATMGFGAFAGIKSSQCLIKKANAWPESKYENLSVNGSYCSWNTFTPLVLNSNTGRREAKITLAANDEFKFSNALGAWGDANPGRSWEGITANATMWDEYTTGTDNFVIKAAGTYVVYYQSGNYGDLAEKGFGIELYHDYKISVGGGADIVLSEAPKGDYDRQWSGTINVTAGSSVAFKQDSSSISATPDSSTNNNVTTFDSKIITTANSVAVYLKKSGSSYTYWIAGRETEFYIYTNNTLIPMATNPSNENERYATSVVLAQNQVVRFYVAALFDANINGSSTGSWSKNGSGQIVTGTAGTYNIYLTPGTPNVVYFGAPSVADAEAIEFATNFLSAVATVCKTDNTTDTSALSSVWSAQDTAFDALGEEAQNILKNASHSGASKVNEFASSYDYIYGKYHTELSNNDFVGRNPSTSSNVLNPLTVNNGTNVAIIIVVVSTISLAALGGFFFIKRKKESK